jgi:hypothetical protein
MRLCDDALLTEAPYSAIGNLVSSAVWFYGKYHGPDPGDNNSSCPCERDKQPSPYPQREHFMTGW